MRHLNQTKTIHKSVVEFGAESDGMSTRSPCMNESYGESVYTFANTITPTRLALTKRASGRVDLHVNNTVW